MPGEIAALSNTSKASTYQKDYLKLVPVFVPIFYTISCKLSEIQNFWL